MLDAPMLLDGGMGTALIARGLTGGVLPEEWQLVMSVKSRFLGRA